jgi:hypothetical protein
MKIKIEPQEIVYDDGDIAVGLVRSPSGNAGLSLALRWLPPQPYRKHGRLVSTTNLMGGETGWFIIPFSLAVGVARTLIEQKAAGLSGFRASGFSKMVSWLVELEEITDAMCY